MSQCWFCGRVKGRRACPARGGELICSRCCGSKRRVEIRCPSECPYLHGAHDPKWTSKTREKEESRFLVPVLALEERPANFYLFLHQLLLTTRNPVASLGDGELLDVVETAVKTLETRAKGVLYHHQAKSPHLQPACDWLVRVVSERERIQGAAAASEIEVLEAFRALARAVDGHVAAGSRDRYLEMVERMMAASLQTAPPLQLPDGLDEPPKSLLVTP